MLPPTSCAVGGIITPTVTFARPPISLVSGSANSISADTTLICDVFCTSTTGLWPLTRSSVSSSAPTAHLGVDLRGEPRRQLDVSRA